MSESPFRAGFGKSPPFLAGRDELISKFGSALGFGGWGQERSILIRGFRGVGKTVLINALEDTARTQGWIVISETANAGFFERTISNHLPRLLNQLDPKNQVRVSQVSVSSIGSITLEYADGREVQETFRSLVTHACELLEKKSVGILFTLDEINEESITDLKDFAAQFQHLIREDREVAFVGAGLPDGIKELLKNKGISFIRRSFPVELDQLNFSDTLTALSEPIETSWRTADDETLDYLARASQGYPFLIQLVGDYAWQNNSESTTINIEDAEKAFQKATRTMGAYIHDPALQELSKTERTVVAAMAQDDGPSKTSDILSRMKVDKNYFSVYRQRLIDKGIIKSTKHGEIDFTIPYLRSHLQTHIVPNIKTTTDTNFPPPPQIP